MSEPCMEPCCAERREAADAWAMLVELYRALIRAGAGSAERRHLYTFNRRTR